MLWTRNAKASELTRSWPSGLRTPAIESTCCLRLAGPCRDRDNHVWPALCHLRGILQALSARAQQSPQPHDARRGNVAGVGHGGGADRAPPSLVCLAMAGGGVRLCLGWTFPHRRQPAGHLRAPVLVVPW